MINPKDLIKKFTVEELCRTAEDFYRSKSITDLTHFLTKPFHSPFETPDILESMGLLLSGLRLGKTMVVLDFGSGSCWFSRFLNQLHCQTISCDTSKTALEIGKQLFQEFPIVGDYISEPKFLHFDGHTIGLPDGSVDRIVCYDAFHHIPNQAEVLAEFARVLKSGGIAGFAEPGKFHSQSLQSQNVMRDYNVLENDINIDEIFSIAQDKGFTHISCKLLCNMEVSFNEYLEVMNDTLSAELKNKIVNNISATMKGKNIFYLYKGRFNADSRSQAGLSHIISADHHDFSIGEQDSLDIPLKICNNGEAQWLINNIRDIGVVHIGTHLYDKNHKLLNYDFSRHDLARPVLPGQTMREIIRVKLPHKGTFNIAVDMVSEEVCWFENVGSKPQYIKVNVK